MLDKQVQDPNLAAAEAFLDAAFDFLGDEVAALGSRREGAASGVSGGYAVVGGTYNVFCQGMMEMG
jgi:hypothetical protein